MYTIIKLYRLLRVRYIIIIFILRTTFGVGLRKRQNVFDESIFSLSRVVGQCTILTPSLQRHLALIYCPDQPIRQRGETYTDKQRTKFEYSAEFAVST